MTAAATPAVTGPAVTGATRGAGALGRRVVGALLALATLAVAAGCTALPGGAPSGPSYQVSADFTEVLDLVPQAAVKVNDVTVGSVDKISLSGWNARVRMRIDRDVQLPANATAMIRQSSLLGEKFVELAAPTGEQATGRLVNDAVIPVSRTSRTAEVEEVLGALGLLLNGGGLAQIKTINEELTDALSGREATVKDLLGQLDTFLAGLDTQRADITKAITALDGFSAQLAQQRATIGAAVDALDPGLTVLAQQRQQLTTALTSLGKLSTVGTQVVNDSRDATLASLKALQPILTQLVRAGDDLPKALGFLLTYPFPPNVTGAISGDFVNLHATIDLDGASILSNLLTTGPPSTSTPGGSTSPGAANPPATSLLPGLPGLLGSPGQSTPTPSPSGSPGTPSGGGKCGLLGILLGCG
jgi:phospholipid/cholesterol/gamma-HCH transport system substrate-binding protein